MIRQEKEGETVLYRRMGIPFALPGTPCCSSFLQELISKAASHICPLVPAGPHWDKILSSCGWPCPAISAEEVWPWPC